MTQEIANLQSSITDVSASSDENEVEETLFSAPNPLSGLGCLTSTLALLLFSSLSNFVSLVVPI